MTKVCNYCNAIVNDNDLFCSKCGNNTKQINFLLTQNGSQEVLDNLRKVTEQAILNLSVDLKKEILMGF
ncbi:MAG: hypothetical protein LBB45_09205 [Methanobrevibacter sp.]|jgi:hypothetical protein|nr:hypothetical protein [Candidatus Methanovirga basalitermitum]